MTTTIVMVSKKREAVVKKVRAALSDFARGHPQFCTMG